MLTLGIPNGSLYESTICLLNRVGLKVEAEGRKFEIKISGPSIFSRALIMRPQDIPEAILDGTIHAGICGWDCVVESNLKGNILKVAELDYSKRTKGPVKIVVFGKKELEDESHILVTSEYPNLARQIFKKAVIKFSHGSTEVKVSHGKYDFGIGVTETGESLKQNSLKILKVLLESPTVLVAANGYPEIKLFGDLLKDGVEK